MTPEEKARELIKKFEYTLIYCENHAKDCALIAVDEVFKVYSALTEDDDLMFPKEIKWWQQVKEEINNL